MSQESSFASTALSNKQETAADSEAKYQLEIVKEELRRALRDKDEAQRKVEQLKREVDELHKGAAEVSRMKLIIDGLRQDNEMLKVSLESSERVRAEQKDMMTRMHKSHALLGENSIISFNSMSSISRRDEADSMQMPAHLTMQSAQPSMMSMAALENRNWLNMASAGRPPLPGQSPNVPTSRASNNPSTSNGSSISNRGKAADVGAKTRMSSRSPAPSPSAPSRRASASAHTSASSSRKKRSSKPKYTDSPSSASESFGDILGTNPSLLPPSALSTYPPLPGYNDFMRSDMPSYAAQQGAGAMTGTLAPGQPAGLHAWPSSILADAMAKPPLYPAMSNNSMLYGGHPYHSSSMPQPSQPPSQQQQQQHAVSSGQVKMKSSKSKVTNKSSGSSRKEAKKRSAAPSTASPSVRVLIRPVASPSSTFSKAPRKLATR